jgi:hypothetical protein
MCYHKSNQLSSLSLISTSCPHARHAHPCAPFHLPPFFCSGPETAYSVALQESGQTSKCRPGTVALTCSPRPSAMFSMPVRAPFFLSLPFLLFFQDPGRHAHPLLHGAVGAQADQQVPALARRFCPAFLAPPEPRRALRHDDGRGRRLRRHGGSRANKGA